MFRRPRSIESWSYAARGVLTILALLAMLPSVILATLGLAFTLTPAALLALPFMLMVARRRASKRRHGRPSNTHLGGVPATRTSYATSA